MRRVQAYADEDFYRLMGDIVERFGMGMKDKFIGAALKKLDRMGVVTAHMIPFMLPMHLQGVLSSSFIAASASTLLISLIIVLAVGFVRAESPEERARALRVLSGFIVGGAMMALAKPIAFWLTGIRYVNGVWYVGGEPADLPRELVSMIDRLLTLLQVIGVVVAIAAAIYGGIQLARRRC